ncbi:MAG: BspA family leucine-rich repeat surface protein [Candidatus Nomurabacteria bacterium]|nr:BspA family leucine-rich repeat surface protein [Candidatus Nomurabacteria bacterium]
MKSFRKKLKIFSLIFIIAFSVFHFSNIALASINDPISNILETDGEVLATAYDASSNIIYIGGTFTHVMSHGGAPKPSNARNNIAAINALTGALLPFDPSPDATVRALALDATGSNIYVGGDFLNMGTTPTTYLAKIKTGDSSVNTTFNFNIFADGKVRALLLSSDGYLYVGGDFTTLDHSATSRKIIGAVIANGLPTDGVTVSSFNPDATGTEVHALAFSSDQHTLYLGGSFSKLNGGTNRNNIAALDSKFGTPNYGKVTTFDPNVNDKVYSIVLDSTNSTLYLGGNFTNVGSITCGATCTRNYLASIKLADGTLNPSFDPKADAPVKALAISSDGSALYVGGDFTNFGGVPAGDRNHLASIKTADGSLNTDFNPGVTGSTVNTLYLTSSSILYAGGLFSKINGTTVIDFTAFDLAPVVSHTLTYTAGANGTISGDSPQTVADGGSGSNVTAVPYFGYSFSKWSDNSDTNPSRTDKNVAGDVTTEAIFNLIPTFNTTWRTTSDLESITIPTTGSGYSYMVDWGDGTSDATVYTGDATHTYDLAGDYHVSITPETVDSFPQIFFNEAVNPEKIISVDRWGGIRWISMQAAFAGCNNLIIDASAGAPDLSMATDTSYMFLNATKVNEGINNSWDVSTIQNMYGMFQSAMSFNQDISSWDVSNVNNMGYMFENDPAFNQDIHLWNVGNVWNMDSMFYSATKFNNGDQPLTWGTNTLNVSNMSSMFRNDTAFDQDISSWNVSAVTNMTDMFTGDTLSITNYDALLSSWSAELLQETVTFDAGNSKYCSSTTQRAFIESNWGWTINDTGIGCHNLSYTSDSNGSISGDKTQINISYNGSGTAVEAIPNEGYRFLNWSDSSIQNPRTDTNVIGDISVTANFELIPIVVVETKHPNGGYPTYGCTDPKALNYSQFVASNPLLCKYSPIIPTAPVLGAPGKCAPELIITQNLKAGSRNGKYNSYTKGIVREADKLQKHLNRLGFASGKVDGIIGPVTRSAIMRMQKFLGTPADGLVGPLTISLINNSCGKN